MRHCKGDENGTARGWREHVGNCGDMVDRWRCCVYDSFLEVDLGREKESEKKRHEAGSQIDRRTKRKGENEEERENERKSLTETI